MTRLGEGFAEHDYLKWELTALVHELRPRGPAAVIGVGGGRDVIVAARAGHNPVVGIELNGLIVDLHRKTMRDFSGIADLPQVELVEDEARSYLVRDARRYSVITMSLIDTWAATGAGAYSLSENGLYTVEGWRIFMERLEPDGIFTVSRWYKPDSPGETARMLALAYQTLWSMGAEKPRGHVILLQNLTIATVLVSPKPFSRADLDAMQKLAVERGFNMLLTPRKLPSNPLLRELAELPDPATLASWADRQLFDLSAPTDARPFFFNMLRPSTWFSPPEAVDELDLAFLGNLHATQTMEFATLASL
jgi:spermidine synthase